MWDTSMGFDDNGGAVSGGGGGFMRDSTSSDKKDEETSKRHHSVVPLFAKQINLSTRDDFKLFNHPVQIASIIGVLREFEVQSTKATCIFEDFTGKIKGILWLDNSKDGSKDLLPFKEGEYVQIYGSIRTQDDEKMIMILKAFPVYDCNIIINHYLSVIHLRLQTEHLRDHKPNYFTNKYPGRELAQSMSEFNDNNCLGGNINYLSSNICGLSSIQEKIYNLLKPCTNSTGIHIATILKSFQPTQKREVEEALESLIEEGHVYSTIDNYHYKSTD